MRDPELVLASTSKYRRHLLTRLGVPFTTMAPRFDERAWEAAHPDARVDELALGMARGKAASLRASASPARWILAADQLAVIEEDGRTQILHKPGTPARAIETLLRLRGRSHRLVNAVERNVTIHWTPKGSVRAKLRLTMERIPRHHGKAPDKMEPTTDWVLQEAELLLNFTTKASRS